MKEPNAESPPPILPKDAIGWLEKGMAHLVAIDTCLENADDYPGHVMKAQLMREHLYEALYCMTVGLYTALRLANPTFAAPRHRQALDRKPPQDKPLET